MPIIQEKVYKDISLTFSPHPVTGKLTVLNNADAVKRALRNNIMTNHGEVPYNHYYGGNVTARLFENFTPITAQLIENDIATAIENFSPRCFPLSIDVFQADDDNRINIKIVFQVINLPEPIELDFFLERIR